MLCAEFPQLPYIDLGELIHVLKTVAIVTSIHLNLSIIFVASLFLSAKISPERRLKLDFGTQKKGPFPLNRGVPSIEATNAKINM